MTEASRQNVTPTDPKNENIRGSRINIMREKKQGVFFEGNKQSTKTYFGTSAEAFKSPYSWTSSTLKCRSL